jgi:catechol 2,3-dioxygenase-like lactoylglutathione lyase family enzyme
MKLNHINLTVPDVHETAAFFEKYFGFGVIAERNEGSLLVLSGENGFILALNECGKAGETGYPPRFHIGFIRNSLSEIDEVVVVMRNDGIEVEAPQRRHDRWNTYFSAPGGVQIEIST